MMVKSMTNVSTKPVVGWREMISLPAIGLSDICAKIDTGARTSALHATNIEQYLDGGKRYVRFVFDHKYGRHGVADKVCTLAIRNLREIKNTSGVPETRVVIATPLRVGAVEQIVEITLSDRANMKCPMIVGRTALAAFNFVVDPSQSWLQSHNPNV